MLIASTRAPAASTAKSRSDARASGSRRPSPRNTASSASSTAKKKRAEISPRASSPHRTRVSASSALPERFALASVTDHVGPAFPPSFVSSGNGDPLEPQARRLAQRLRGEGVAVETLFFAAGRRPELPHEYQFNLDDPAGAEALERMAAFAHRHAGSPPRASRD